MHTCEGAVICMQPTPLLQLLFGGVLLQGLVVQQAALVTAGPGHDAPQSPFLNTCAPLECQVLVYVSGKLHAHLQSVSITTPMRGLGWSWTIAPSRKLVTS